MAKAATKTKVSNKIPAPVDEQKPQPQDASPIQPSPAPRVAKPGTLQGAEYKIVEFVYTAEREDTLEDIQRPEFWTHYTMKLTGMGRITVINRFAGWEASLRVLEIGKGYARVVLLSHNEWKTPVRDSAEMARLRAQYKTEARPDGWRVTGPQGEMLISALPSKEEADAFVTQLLAQSEAA